MDSGQQVPLAARAIRSVHFPTSPLKAKPPLMPRWMVGSSSVGPMITTPAGGRR